MSYCWDTICNGGTDWRTDRQMDRRTDGVILICLPKLLRGHKKKIYLSVKFHQICFSSLWAIAKTWFVMDGRTVRFYYASRSCFGGIKKKIYFFSVNTHSWNYWYFQHIRWNIFGIHLKKVNILYIFVQSFMKISQRVFELLHGHEIMTDGQMDRQTDGWTDGRTRWLL